MWRSFDDGKTIGKLGYENGQIIFDDEHVDGARITLERDTDLAPFSVTCGVYGCFFHTRFLATEEDAEYDLMKRSLENILSFCISQKGPNHLSDESALGFVIEEFVNRFPS